MRTLLLPLLALLCLSLNTFAQTGACNLYAVTIEFVSADISATDPSKRDLRLNLSWDSDINGGSAATYFHIWPDNAYAAIDYSKVKKGPKAADLIATLGTIVIQNPATNPTIIGSYAPDATYNKMLGVGSTITRTPLGNGTERYSITNLVIPEVMPRVDGSYGFAGDIWTSQSGDNVHCFSTGKSFVVNEVASRSQFSCVSGGKLRVTLVSTQPSATGTYQLYIENANPGTVDPASDIKFGSEQTFTTGSTPTLGGDYPYAFNATEIEVPSEYNGKMIWLVVTPTGKSSQVFFVSNTCAALPVTFGDFTAVRKGQSVFVKWQTHMELNVAGFNVQRLTNGNWTNLAFVQAKNMANGSSYELTDANSYKGLSQYRIVSVDIDGKQKASEIRSVRGEESITKLTVYPNPSTTGRINLVFDNSATRDIAVIDMSGRIVKQLQGQKGANVSFELMQDGLYQVQVTDRTTGEQIVEKIIVKKR